MRPGPLDAGMHRVYQRRKRGEEPVDLRAPRARADPRADVRRHHLPGAGDAHRAGARRHLARRSRRAAQGGRQEGRGADSSRSSGSSSRRRSRAATTATIIEEIAGQIETFGRYGFNKSHSVAYSIISYQTAWLKAHYPAEFMAALLSSSIGDTDSVVKFINEARELGIEVLPPDVNESGYKFTVVGDKRIRFGLGAIRNVGPRGDRLDPRGARATGRSRRSSISASASICGSATSACSRRSSRPARSTTLGGHRAQYWAVLDSALQEASLKQQEAASGQGSLLRRSATATTAARARSSPRAAQHRAAGATRERLDARRRRFSASTSPGIRSSRSASECELFATHTVSRARARGRPADRRSASWSRRSRDRSASGPAPSSRG